MLLWSPLRRHRGTAASSGGSSSSDTFGVSLCSGGGKDRISVRCCMLCLQGRSLACKKACRNACRTLTASSRLMSSSGRAAPLRQVLIQKTPLRAPQGCAAARRGAAVERKTRQMAATTILLLLAGTASAQRVWRPRSYRSVMEAYECVCLAGGAMHACSEKGKPWSLSTSHRFLSPLPQKPRRRPSKHTTVANTLLPTGPYPEQHSTRAPQPTR